MDKIYRLEIASTIPDTRAQVRLKALHDLNLQGKVSQVNLVDVYTIDKALTKLQCQKIALALHTPSVQTTRPKIKNFAYAIEIGFLPGVTDNIGNTAKETIEDLLGKKFKNGENVYSSQVTYIAGSLTRKDAETIAASLHNPLIEKATIGKTTKIPKVKLTANPQVDTVNLDLPDSELQILGKQGIPNSDSTRRGPLALSLDYLHAIQKYFKKLKRSPTDIELESLAQTWSEHCKHTIFADPIDELKHGLFKTYIKAATTKINSKICVSVFTDNSGAIEFDDQWLITDKVETHNSPSALDPFGGSITGIVGVNRDALGFGLGAKPVINRYGFCLADPKDKTTLYKGPNFTQPMLSAQRIMSGVIKGVNSGGNCSGIPTPQGFLYFDPRYRGKPLVFVGTVGLIPRSINKKPTYKKQAKPGDYIVMIGGRVGLDGIHGATFSSEAMDTGSPAGAVQIGDPITQKKLSDALVKEARDQGLYNSITDNGAGGLSCSVAEMAKESGGCTVELDQVPLKYPGMAPWQIWISESQERMTLAVPPSKWPKFHQLMHSRGVEATKIGKFTPSGKCRVTYHGKTIMDIDMNFLHNGLPSHHLNTTFTKITHPEPKLPQPKDLTPTLLKMLARPNLSGFSFLSSQYDHEVQAGSVIKPLQGRGLVNSDATIVKPVLNSPKAVVLSQALYPSYSDIDTYHMAAASIDTAIRQAVAVGADLDHLALLDNFCWCSSDDPKRLGQLKLAAQACYDYSVAYGTPLISGKDSMFNDFKGFDTQGNPIKISVPPTLLISSIGVISDATKTISLDAKFPGDLVYVLGETHDELGGSEYFALHKAIGNSVPQVDAHKNLKLYNALHNCIQSNLIASAQSVGRGGLIIALAKTAMGGLLGMELSLPKSNLRADFYLFSESAGRLVVTVNPKNKREFEKAIPHTFLGTVTTKPQFIVDKLIHTNVNKLLNAYRSTFKNL